MYIYIIMSNIYYIICVHVYMYPQLQSVVALINQQSLLLSQPVTVFQL